MSLTRRTDLARIVSIVGHPVVTMTLAAFIATRSAGAGLTWVDLAGVVSLGLLVVAYSMYKVRAGDWAHVDASNKHERAQLNRTVGALLVIVACVLFLIKANYGVALVVGLSGAIVLAGHALGRYCKASLHVAFAVFAALIVSSDIRAALCMAVLAGLVAWSRLQLKRHVLRDVLVGALLGLGASGILFLVMHNS